MRANKLSPHTMVCGGRYSLVIVRHPENEMPDPRKIGHDVLVVLATGLRRPQMTIELAEAAVAWIAQAAPPFRPLPFGWRLKKIQQKANRDRQAAKLRLLRSTTNPQELTSREDWSDINRIIRNYRSRFPRFTARFNGIVKTIAKRGDKPCEIVPAVVREKLRLDENGMAELCGIALQTWKKWESDGRPSDRAGVRLLELVLYLNKYSLIQDFLNQTKYK